jgi:hypothetical protein
MSKISDELSRAIASGDASTTAKAMTDAQVKLAQLRQLATESFDEELAALDKLTQRATHLETHPLQRADVICLAIVEFLLRHRCIDSARAVLESMGAEAAELADFDVLLGILDVAQRLRRDRELAPAVRWAADNASRLRRIESTLEFALRKQEFVEIVRRGDVAAALEHASVYLAPAAKIASAVAAGEGSAGGGGAGEAVGASGGGGAASTGAGSGAGSADVAGSAAGAAAAAAGGPDSTRGIEDGQSLYRKPAQTPMQALQEAMSMLAFPQPATCGVPAVERMFAPGAWEALATHFEADALCAAGFTHRPLLEHLIATGVLALKSLSCHSERVPPAAPAHAAPGHSGGGASATGSGGGSRVTAADAGGSGPHTRGGIILLPPAPPRISSSAAAADGSASSAAAASAAATPGAADGSGAGSAAGDFAAGAAAPPPDYGTCPLCIPGYFSTALEASPYCRVSVTRLLCPITHEPMDERNPPLVLPSGHVYGTRTLELLSSEDRRLVLCPLTGQTYPADAVRKAFFV